MKRVYRFVLVALCVVLWLCVGAFAYRIENSARNPPNWNRFSFPGFIPDTEIYLWSISSNSGAACLVLQNISDAVIFDLEIVLSCGGKALIFETDQIDPSEKVYLMEKNSTDILDNASITYTSHTFR